MSWERNDGDRGVLRAVEGTLGGKRNVENVQRIIKGFKWAGYYNWHWVAKGQLTYVWSTSKYLINILKHKLSIVLLILLVFHNLGENPVSNIIENWKLLLCEL